MKALVLEEYNRLVFCDVPKPQIGEDEVLLQVKACGICGSDVHGLDGSTGRRIPPLIMGHEAAGEIVELGDQVAGWKLGERVTFDSTVYCGKCWYCLRGRPNLCDNRQVLGVSCEEHRREGAFADYVAVPARILYHIPSAVSFEEAAMVEPTSVAVHAVGRLGVKLGDAAVVIGAGVIGLLAVQALRSAGCGWLAAVDVDDSRLELAQELGADAAIKPEKALRVVREATEGRGTELVVEAVGVEATVRMATECVRKGGSIALVGNVSPEAPLMLQSAVSREFSFLGSAASCGEYPACLKMIEKGVIKVKPLISAIAPLAEGTDWFARLYNREKGLMKVILTP